MTDDRARDDLFDPTLDALPDEAAAELRTVYLVPPSSATEARHLIAMQAAAGSPASPSVHRRLWAVAAAVLAVGLVGFGGLASAGALPGPVQDAVASVASAVGLDLPDADEDDDNDNDDIDPAPVTTAPPAPGTTPPTTADPIEGTPAPGHDPNGPGNSENAPGQAPNGPGNSENAPGHDPNGPGNSENAPGQDPNGPGNSENAPGPPEVTPGAPENTPGGPKP
jgi:hypothetical protein